jgi:hypothetical protein
VYDCIALLVRSLRGDQYVGELQTAIEGAHRVARETLKQAQKRKKRDYDVKVRVREFLRRTLMPLPTAIGIDPSSADFFQ